MTNRCKYPCPHRFYTGEIIRCYLCPKPGADLSNHLADNYKESKEITCSECILARERYRETNHRQPPRLKTTLNLCTAQQPHTRPYYTVEEEP